MTDGEAFPDDGRRRQSGVLSEHNWKRSALAAHNWKRSALTATAMQDRYGRRNTPSRQRLLLAAGAGALAIALAFVAWLSLFGRASVNWDDIGFHVLSDAQIEVTFDVNFSKSGAGEDPPRAICTIQALNNLSTEVGLQDVAVQAGPGGRVRATVTMQTSERATTGLVKSCAPTGS